MSESVTGKLSCRLNNTTLKWIALLSMTIDHIGIVLFPEGTGIYILFRLLGRLAFPIYCALLTEGNAHTRNPKRYILRLGLFALISEIPYNLAMKGTLWDLGEQNVFFTLCLGELMLRLIGWIRGKLEDVWIQNLTILAAAVLFMGAAELLKTDYGMGGILLIFILYMLRPWNEKKLTFTALLMAVCWYNSRIQLFAVLALPCLVGLYDGTRGRTGRGMKYMFYLYYPIHLLILSGLRILISGQ